MTERRGVFSILKHPLVYEAVQQVFNVENSRRWFAGKYVVAKSGDRVLDIGCGPANLLAHLPAVDYIGWEPNPAYVETAQRAYASRGNCSFHAGYFGDEQAEQLKNVDIAIVSAVLHHLTDAEAKHLFQLLRRVVRPGGRVVSLDCAYIDGQNLMARLLVSLDRGKHARRPDAYKALASEAFDDVTGDVRNLRFPPYNYWIMTAR